MLTIASCQQRINSASSPRYGLNSVISSFEREAKTYSKRVDQKARGNEGRYSFRDRLSIGEMKEFLTKKVCELIKNEGLKQRYLDRIENVDQPLIWAPRRAKPRVIGRVSEDFQQRARDVFRALSDEVKLDPDIAPAKVTMLKPGATKV